MSTSYYLQEKEKITLLEGALSKYKINYVQQRTVNEILEALNDKYAQEYNSREMDEMCISYMKGDLSLNGFLIKKNRIGNVVVDYCNEQSEAYLKGMRKGDVISFIGKEGIIHKSILQTYILLRRRPIDIEIIGKKSIILVSKNMYDINRNSLPVYHLIHDKLRGWCYIKLKSFSEDVCSDFEKTIRNESKLVIDLRGNEGGTVCSCLSILNMLIADGNKLGTICFGGKKEELKSSSKEKINKKIIVLINNKTASVAEWFASAIAYNKGFLIGEKTFGKGLIQTVLSFAHIDGTGVKFSVAEMLTADGKKIEGCGIRPHYIIEQIDNINSLNEIVGWIENNLFIH